jgi:hypothetical protein
VLIFADRPFAFGLSGGPESEQRQNSIRLDETNVRSKFSACCRETACRADEEIHAAGQTGMHEQRQLP